jgi:hypothetical protein
MPRLKQKVTQNEPKTHEEQNEVLSLMQTLLSDTEINYEEKMAYMFAFCQEIMSHSYGLFPKNFRSEE